MKPGTPESVKTYSEYARIIMEMPRRKTIPHSKVCNGLSGYWLEQKQAYTNGRNSLQVTSMTLHVYPIVFKTRRRAVLIAVVVSLPCLKVVLCSGQPVFCVMWMTPSLLPFWVGGLIIGMEYVQRKLFLQAVFPGT